MWVSIRNTDGSIRFSGTAAVVVVTDDDYAEDQSKGNQEALDGIADLLNNGTWGITDVMKIADLVNNTGRKVLHAGLPAPSR